MGGPNKPIILPIYDRPSNIQRKMELVLRYIEELKVMLDYYGWVFTADPWNRWKSNYSVAILHIGNVYQKDQSKDNENNRLHTFGSYINQQEQCWQRREQIERQQYR